MAPARAEKPIFRDLIIAIAGDLGGQWTDANIQRWVTMRAGKFNQDMDGSVTHLVCSPEEFKKKGSRVKQALRCDHRACHIVTKDWIEDSISKRRRLPEKPFLLSAAFKEERRKRILQARVTKGIEQAETFVNTNLFHIYTDSTFFRYEITITREDEEQGVQEERYVLHLFESNAKPHLYHFAAKYYRKKGDSRPQRYRPSDTAQSFSAEFAHFKAFFAKKTGITWDDRLAKAESMTETDRTLFRYEPPTGGKPVGVVEEPLSALPQERTDSVAVQKLVESEGGGQVV